MTFMGIDNQTSVKPYPLFQYQYLLIMDICMETSETSWIFSSLCVPQSLTWFVTWLQRYGPVISTIPQQLSRFQFNMMTV